MTVSLIKKFITNIKKEGFSKTASITIRFLKNTFNYKRKYKRKKYFRETTDLNMIFVNKHNLVGYENMEVDKLRIENSKSGNCYELSNLTYIDEINSLISVDEQNLYEFVDVGCGSGISTIYAAMHLNFKNYKGFDFSELLIYMAIENLKRIDSEQYDINFFTADAASYSSADKLVFFYLFNPFDENILEKFILNNIENFKKNSCKIFYVNNKHINIFSNFSYVSIANFDKTIYQNSLIEF